MDEALIPELIAVSSELRLGNANEATTRFKLIDALLIDLLGWNKTDIRVEERVAGDENSQFVDYIISAGAHSFLIEAKRVGKFKNDFPTFRKGKLSDNWVKRTEVKKAIDQAIEYGRSKSVGFCIITDGINWAVFPINRRDQVTISDSLAEIFSNLKSSDRDTFQEFEVLLSRAAVLDGSLDRELFGTERDQIDSRRLNMIYDRSFSRSRRKSIFPAIEREIVMAFSEELLSENNDLLEKCYVETPERTSTQKSKCS